MNSDFNSTSTHSDSDNDWEPPDTHANYYGW